MSHLVSIITVNYYSEDEILKCYSSILEKSTTDIEFIVVSNSPLDSTFTEQLNKLNPEVKIHQTQENLGFSKACNIGADLANGEFLFFLNPDTRFINDVVRELLQCHQTWDNPGVLGAKTYDQHNRLEASAKNHLSKIYFLTLVFPFLNPFFPSRKYGPFLPKKTTEVPVLNGHSLFLRHTLFKEIGGMEEGFFMYWEENDLCLCAKQLNYDNIYCAEAKLMHLSGTSTRPFFIKMEIEKHRSQKKFILKHYPSWNMLNRISGVFGYFWRTLLSPLSFNKMKMQQFWNLFVWYLFSYD